MEYGIVGVPSARKDGVKGSRKEKESGIGTLVNNLIVDALDATGNRYAKSGGGGTAPKISREAKHLIMAAPPPPDFFQSLSSGVQVMKAIALLLAVGW